MTRVLDFTKSNGIIPVIIQEEKTGEVLMLGYMNNEAYQKTLEIEFVFFWSRSRQKLWLKGEESGNKLKVKKIYSDCDKDSILIKVQLMGENACHTGRRSCFNLMKENKHVF